jgi:hypothetical protein
MKESWGKANGKDHTPEELPFYMDDSEEQYALNWSHNYDELLRNGWIFQEPEGAEDVVGYKYDYNTMDPKQGDWVNLSYRINSHGFRGEEMPTEPKKRSIICLGDSNTFGIGMPEGKLWSTRIGHTLKVRSYNLGIPNGSLDSAFRVLMYWLPKIKPSHVFMCTPFEGYEHHIHSGILNAGYPLATTEDEWILHKEKVLRAMQHLCDQFDTPLIQDDCCGDDYFSIFQEHDLSRDLKYYGSNRHIYIAMNLLRKAGYEWDV